MLTAGRSGKHERVICIQCSPSYKTDITCPCTLQVYLYPAGIFPDIRTRISVLQASQSVDGGQSHNSSSRSFTRLGTLYLPHRGHDVGSTFNLYYIITLSLCKFD